MGKVTFFFTIIRTVIFVVYFSGLVLLDDLLNQLWYMLFMFVGLFLSLIPWSEIGHKFLFYPKREIEINNITINIVSRNRPDRKILLPHLDYVKIFVDDARIIIEFKEECQLPRMYEFAFNLFEQIFYINTIAIHQNTLS